MEKMKIVICDDQEADRKYYEALARELGKKWNIALKIKTYTNGDDIMFDVEDPDYLKIVDIMILDINMPGPSGIKISEAARENGYRGLIVFLTASTSHYEPAFDVGGYNYITKNENAPERFEKVFRKALTAAKLDNRKAIVLTCGGDYLQLDIQSIRYFKVFRNMTTVHYGKNETFDFISTLNKLEDQLVSHGFLRVQRSYLVNLNYVQRIAFDNLLLNDGTNIPVGRKYYKDLKEAMLEL